MKAVVSNGKFLTLHYLCWQEYVFKIPICANQSSNLFWSKCKWFMQLSLFKPT